MQKVEFVALEIGKKQTRKGEQDYALLDIAPRGRLFYAKVNYGRFDATNITIWRDKDLGVQFEEFHPFTGTAVRIFTDWALGNNKKIWRLLDSDPLLLHSI